MTPTWLIETGVYGEEIAPLVAEIRRQGMAVESLSHRILSQQRRVTAGGRVVDEGACVIGYGTSPFVREIQLHRSWIPGAWYAPDNLDCRAYYPRFEKHLLNRRYVVLSYVEAISARDRLFDEFGHDDRVFVRPSASNKQFVGRVTDLESFADALAPARFDPACHVVVAEPQTIGREWRLVVVEGRVIAGSRYAVNGERSVAAGLPTSVIVFAKRVLAEVDWTPDPAFMLDVCEAAGELRVVELNGFSTSWLYAADFRAVIAAATDLAFRTWRDRDDPA
jgi:hypothetical protein